ncbi:MAG: hypothetical protein AMXMBFR20_25500 [Planctomycetia bacterium]
MVEAGKIGTIGDIVGLIGEDDALNGDELPAMVGGSLQENLPVQRCAGCSIGWLNGRRMRVDISAEPIEGGIVEREHAVTDAFEQPLAFGEGIA